MFHRLQVLRMNDDLTLNTLKYKFQFFASRVLQPFASNGKMSFMELTGELLS